MDIENGFWWLPGSEDDPIPGSLTVADTGYYLLELLHPIVAVDNSTFPALRAIHGVVGSGKQYTLYRSTFAGSEVSMPGFERQSWESPFVLSGRHVEAGGHFRIGRLDLQYSYLSAWLNRSALKLSLDRSEGTATIHGASVQPLKYRAADNLDVWLVTDSSVGSLRQPLKHVSLHEEDWLSLRFREPTSIDDAWEYVSSFQTLLTLLIGRPCQPVRARALAPKTGDETLDLRRWVEIEGQWRHAEGTEIKHPLQVLVPHRRISERFEHVVQEWLNASSVIAPSIDLYFGTVLNPSSNLNRSFLLLAQAAESLHRRTSDETEIPHSAHEARLAEILSSVPGEFVPWLRDKLKYSNELSLAKRLRALKKEYLPKGVQLGGRKFIRGVVDTRNYLTHWDDALIDRARQDTELLRLTNNLRTLLECSFLSRLGLTSTEIAGIMARPIAERESMKPAEYVDNSA